MYENIKGIFGLCQRTSRMKTQQQLVDIIKEKDLSLLKMVQYEDPDSDFIWCIFFEGELENTEEDSINWIMENDDYRIW